MFDYPTSRDAFVVTGAPTVWSRADIRVTADAPTKRSQSLHVDFASGERIDVDINFSVGAFRVFNDPMRDLLLAPVSV
ncbi:hypothetical protein BH10ACT3_BH10ACT3_08270 [soil metagenome]